MVKNLSANMGDTRDTGSIPGSGGYSGAGNGNPPQYSCLENSRPRSLAGYTPWDPKELDTTEQECNMLSLKEDFALIAYSPCKPPLPNTVYLGVKNFKSCI